MATAGLYRRVLPSPPALEFASPEGKQLFREALEGGTMEGFFKLISYYQTQSEPAYCGLATLAMVLNALAIDPGRTWKGPWRWFDDSMLDCCEPLWKIKTEGTTFGSVACLATCNGAKVDAFQTNQSTTDDFRKHVISCASVEDSHVIVSYHRGTLKQTGSGHFSPIGGYHSGRDMVLILDVARFKYPPHWIPLALLWEAMDTIDGATGKHRGYMILSRHWKAPSVLYTMTCKSWGWANAIRYLTDDVPSLLKSEDMRDVCRILSVIYNTAPTDLKEIITWVAEVRRQEDGANMLSEEEKGRLAFKEELLWQVRETELFKHVFSWMVSESSLSRDAVREGDEVSLDEIAADVCCQGAEILSGKLGLLDGISCTETNVRIIHADGKKTATIVSGTVTQDDNEQGVDMLVPISQSNSSSSQDFVQNCCSKMHPSTVDVLTLLLLVIPEHTWFGVKDPKVQEELRSLTSTDNFPTLLQDEVLHLRQQLHFLMTEKAAEFALNGLKTP